MGETIRQIVNTDLAPAAIGPYSQGVAARGLLFVSGQLPIDPATGALVRGEAAEQARRALANVTAVLEAGGASRENLVKTTVLLADIADFGAVNEVYAEWITESADPPARAAFQVAALPAGARVEVEAIAVVAENAR